MPFNIFKRDIDYIQSLLDIGKEPTLNQDEIDALSNYSMKRSRGYTPILK